MKMMKLEFFLPLPVDSYILMKGEKMERLNKHQDYSKEYHERIEEGWFVHQPKANLKRIYLEVSSRCNLACIMCVRNNWNFEPGDMQMELFDKILAQLKDFPLLKEVVLGGFGEPFVHPEIIQMVNKLKKQGLKVLITTNGILINEKVARELIKMKADDLIISVDGISTQKYAQIRRGGDLKQVISNIQRLNEIKSMENTIFPRINIEFVLMKKNKDELEDIPKFAQAMHALRVLVTNLLPHTKDMTEEILYGGSDPYANEDFFPKFWASPVEGFATMCTVDFPRLNWGAFRRCRFTERKAAVVSWKGKVAPCYALLHDNKYYIFGREKNLTAHYFGDLNEKKLRSIWLSREYTVFRNKIRFFSFPSCMECSIKNNCGYALDNEDCWGNAPSCSDCLWSQDIILCP